MRISRRPVPEATLAEVDALLLRRGLRRTHDRPRAYRIDRAMRWALGEDLLVTWREMHILGESIIEVEGDHPDHDHILGMLPALPWQELLPGTTDPDPRRRLRAIRGIAAAVPDWEPALGDALLRLLGDREPGVRQGTLTAIRAGGWPEAAALLERRMQTEPEPLLAEAMEELARRLRTREDGSTDPAAL